MSRPYGLVLWVLATLFLVAGAVQAKPKDVDRVKAVKTLEEWEQVDSEVRETLADLPHEERRELRRASRDKRRELKRADRELKRQERRDD